MVPVALKPRAALAGETMPLLGTFADQAELVTAISSCGPGDTACNACLASSGFYVEAQGVGNTSQGPLYFEVLKCFNLAGGSFGTYAGRFAMTAPTERICCPVPIPARTITQEMRMASARLVVSWRSPAELGNSLPAHGSATFTAVAGPFTPCPTANAGMLMAFYSIRGNLTLPND